METTVNAAGPLEAPVRGLEPVAYGNMDVRLNANDRVLFLACEKQTADRYHEQCYDLTPLYTIPEGWALVPKEPTQAMFEAGDATFISGYTGTPTSDPITVWQAMLNAAPLPPNAPLNRRGAEGGASGSAQS